VRGLKIKIWVLSIASCMIGNPQNCLKSSMTTSIYAPIGQDMIFKNTTFMETTNSCSTNDIMDFPIAKSSLQIKKLAPWANVYIMYNTLISIWIVCLYWIFYFINITSCNLSTIPNNVIFINLNFSICLSSSYLMSKNQENHVVLLNFT